MEAPPKVIFLEPDCPNCGEPAASDSRMWCEDDVWTGECDACCAPVVAIRYVLAATKDGE